MNKTKKPKRKIVYAIMMFLLIVGLLVGLRLGFGFFTPYNSWTARQDIKNGKVQIIAVGLPFMPELRNKLAQQYGFHFSYAGCNATTELMNGSDCYNEVVKEYLADKYGKDFWDVFNAKLDSIYNLELVAENTSHVIELVREQKMVQDKLKYLDSEYEVQRNIEFTAVLNDTVKNIYLVKVYEYIDTNRVTYFNFLVNATFNTIINADGKMQLK